TAANQMPPQAPTETTIPDEPVSSKEPATLVPEGTDLKQYCEKYYSAWQKGDWQTAYDLQPLSKKKDKTLDDFSQSLQGYGMTSYVVGDPKISGNSGTVGVNLDLGQNGIWKTNWTFVKNDKGQWTVFNSITSPIQ
ncbi:MAG TPA: hypothetical protein VE439_10825, partial [Anaerolineae bacterium]|nr:hypothetical protein [Anaerolineae bacterium]